MLKLLKRIFLWWDADCTVGTALYTMRFGKEVGKDDQGSTYYESKEGRRWVIYSGKIEASRIPPEWHAWIHKTVKLPPNQQAPVVQPWEKDHVENPTGGEGAYFPDGSPHAKGARAKATGDYEAWQPE